MLRLKALTRGVSPSISHCELTHVERTVIDHGAATSQHEVYESLLRRLAVDVETIPADPNFPDCVFVEDTAVVADEFALITRPGAESRRGEGEAIAQRLSHYREVQWMDGPATLDGGDVLRSGRTFFVGVGARTNEEGAAELARVAEPFDYEVRAVPLGKCLHLKTAVTEVADGVLLYNPQWIGKGAFGGALGGFEWIPVDPSEPFAANCLRIGDSILQEASHSKTREALVRRGIKVVPVDISELAKAEAGVTCCSILFSVGK